MVGRGARRDTVRFEFRPAHAAGRVMIAGDFNGWRPRPMVRRSDRFAAVESLPAGTWQYKFLVDDRWVTDPDNHHWAPNPFGSVNSVVEVASPCEEVNRG